MTVISAIHPLSKFPVSRTFPHKPYLSLQTAPFRTENIFLFTFSLYSLRLFFLNSVTYTWLMSNPFSLNAEFMNS